MQATHILLHYAEIATKGKNRPNFEARLADNVKLALSGLPLQRIEKLNGRLLAVARDGETFGPETLVRLHTVYGLSDFSPVTRTSLDLDAIKAKAAAMLEGRHYESFRVSARRAFKRLPYTSIELNEQVGAHLLARKPAQVRMNGAELELHIECVPGGAYLYVDKHRGAGGLPVGVSGRVAVLLSGGIDSPVAAARMQRRGLRCVFIHFHSHPFHSRASQEKAVTLATHLAAFQGQARLYLVPFGELQRTIVTQAPAALRVVLYRRFMLRIAQHLARREEARALVTGEAIGQVASQTLDNMIVINAAAAGMAVLRPLCGFDKQEIVDQAHALGTYETSILPDQDCCQLFMPSHPETRARMRDVEAAEATLDVQALCEAAVAAAQKQTLRARWLSEVADEALPQDNCLAPPLALRAVTP